MNKLYSDLLTIAATEEGDTEHLLDTILKRIKAEAPSEDNRAYMCECIGTNCTIHKYAAGYNKGVREFIAVIDSALTSHK